MADMDWVRKTHDVYIEGMQQHAAELENNNERHLYGAAINRITLLMEHIDELEVAARAVVDASERAVRETSPQTPYIQPDYLLRAIAALIKEKNDENDLRASLDALDAMWREKNDAL